MTSPTGAAIRRAERPATTNSSTSRARPVTPATPRACPWRPTAPDTSSTSSALTMNTSPKNTARKSPTRRANGPRRHGSSERGSAASDPRGSSGSVIGEPVSHAVDGQNVAGGAGGGLDLLAEILHVRVDGTFVGLERDAVDGVEQLAAREDAPW